MHTKRCFLLLSAAVLFFISCNKNTVSLTYTNAKDEVPLLGNLVFRFSQSMVKDSVLNAWDSTEYISFEPAIRGKFRWESPDQLVFSPSEPLQPATNYKARVRNAVLRFSAYNDVDEGKGVQFHTPGLELEQSRITWIGESGTTAVPQLDLAFNYLVNPADLQEKLQIEVDGKKAAHSIITASPDNRISVRITGLKNEDRDLSSKLIINQGLKPVYGNNATTEPISVALSIPSPYVLNILDIESQHDGTEGIVRVVTSQQLTGESLKPYLKLDPHLKYTVEQQDNGFTIRSDNFSVERSYVLNIAKGLRGKIGGVLKEDYSGSIAFGELEANIRFTSKKAVYLSKTGAGNIEVQITSTPKIKLVISKIYENNLLMAQQYGYYPRETRPSYASSRDEYEDGYYYEDYSDVMLGDVIFEKEIDTRSLPKSGSARLLNISQFEDRLPEARGIYHVMIRSLDHYWVRDSRFISMSDIGLIAREGQEKIFVFANSIRDARPAASVDIAVYAANNQLIGKAATNAEGVAEISWTRKDFAGFKPAMIIAKTADDFNYLPFNNTRVNTSRFDVGGKRSNPAGLDAFIYAERDIYRPGEVVNFAAVIRDRQWNSPADLPLKAKFLMPNGKELKSFRKSLNEEGAFEASLAIANTAITGTYTLELYTSNDILLATKNFSIEEFVPDRIRVNAKLNKTALRPGETTVLNVNAMNFFGPPAANRNYELEIQVKRKNFTSTSFADFDFALANNGGFFDKIIRQGRTDAEGNATESYQVPGTYADAGLLQTNFYTTVFDETGRPVSRMSTADIFTQDVFYGIKRDWSYYFPLNQPAKFMLAAADREGKATTAKARVVVIKQEYKTVLARSGSYFRYQSQKQERVMAENELSVGSNTVYSYVPRSPGEYELRVYRPGANSYVSRRFYSYGSWGGDNNSFEVNNEGNIDIELDKKKYLSGESVKALFKAPFDGRMLVTVETDRIISYHYLDVNNRNASLDLKLNGDHVPNAYITATLFKPHEVSDIPLTVAHGFQNVTVEEKARKIDVSIDAQKTSRSVTKQKVKVKAEPGSYITLAAVDNGVLQITNFQTPSPYEHFYQKRALQVSAYDLYPLLFAETRARLSSTGGDGELSMQKRVNPMPAKRVKVMSYWSGIKKANSSGNAEFEFEIPGFNGEIRLMAVAYKGQHFGSSENTMTVADPLVISTALPRFLSPGDTVFVPVTLSNTTEKAGSIKANIATTGPVKVLGENNQSLSIAAKSEGAAGFRIVADPNIGIGKIKITADGLGEKFTDETEISVRPPSTLQKITGSGVIAAGSAKKIQINTSDFIKESADYKLVISRSPMLELGEHLKYLIQYPYGCTEQTISSAFPQLYYGDMADLMQMNLQKGTTARQNQLNANSNILEAIRKIKMRQLYNGALTLWDGEGKEDWWTTVYGAHFLLEARKAGFDVDNSLLETMLGYLINRLKNKEQITYYYNRNQNKKIAPKEVTYSLYVLALAGRANVPAMNYYKEKPELLALDSRYLLSAAYAIAGDKKSFGSILPASFAGEESVQQSGGSYYSAVRDEAIALNALLEVDPGNTQVPVMVKHVNEKLKSSRWLNTQERAFAFLALGKVARSANQSTATGEVKAGGKTIAKLDGGQWIGDKADLKGQEVEIVTKGNGSLYYYWEAEGISASGDYVEEDNYLRVRRRFFDRHGQPITGNNFNQNDLIIVGITLEKSFSTPVENVVITDLIPAGFEIENPRTKDIPGMDWIKDASSPLSLDVRDDRIHFFVDANNNRQNYYYAVRAVSPGRYKMGPVSADAMYQGEYHSYHGAGVISISR